MTARTPPAGRPPTLFDDDLAPGDWLCGCQPVRASVDHMARRDDVVHGTRPGYKRGCTCSACLGAAAAYMRDYRAGHRGTNAHPVPYTGVTAADRNAAKRAARR
jgi:hypothetical protein